MQIEKLVDFSGKKVLFLPSLKKEHISTDIIYNNAIITIKLKAANHKLHCTYMQN